MASKVCGGKKKRGRFLLPLAALLTFVGVSLLIVSLLFLVLLSLSVAGVIIRADICSGLCVFLGGGFGPWTIVPLTAS